MAERLRAPGAYLLFTLLVSACLWQVTPVLAADEAEVAATTQQLEQLRKRMDKLRNKLNQRRGERSKQQRALEETDVAIGDISAELRRTGKSIRTSTGRLDELESNRKAEQRALDRLHAQLKRELRATYMAGRQSQVKLLLNQEDPASFGRTLVYQGYFARARGARMDAVRASLARLADIETGLKVTHEELLVLREQQEQQSQALHAEQAQQKQVLAGIDAELADADSQLKKLQQDEQRLAELLKSLRRALADIPLGEFDQPIKTLKGKLDWPVSGKITRNFGAPTEGRLRSRGVYISSSPDAEVRAIAHGRVAFADWLRGFGLLLIIEHGDGYMSLYGHNNTLYREVGEWVERGDVVSAAGNSGGSRQSGLYLELRKDGNPLNPRGWFRGKPRARG